MWGVIIPNQNLDCKFDLMPYIKTRVDIMTDASPSIRTAESYQRGDFYLYCPMMGDLLLTEVDFELGLIVVRGRDECPPSNVLQKPGRYPTSTDFVFNRHGILDIFRYTGKPMLFPSKELYLKHLFDIESAWCEWKEDMEAKQG